MVLSSASSQQLQWHVTWTDCIEIDSLSEVIGTRARCFEHASRSLAWTTSPHQEPNRSLNPDEAVVVMLRVQGGIITGEGPSRGRDRCYRRDSFAHGLHTVGGVMTKLINTTPPCRGAADDVSSWSTT